MIVKIALKWFPRVLRAISYRSSSKMEIKISINRNMLKVVKK